MEINRFHVKRYGIGMEQSENSGESFEITRTAPMSMNKADSEERVDRLKC